MFPFVSCSQTDSEFILQKSFSVISDINCITKDNCFSFCIDTNNFCLTVFYSHVKNENKYIIDCIDFGDNPTLNCFKSKKNDSYIVVLKLEYEFCPIFYVYFIDKREIIKIGHWSITEPCIEYREYLDYSTKDIRIFQKEDEIEFLFLKDTRFIVNKEDFTYDDWGTFKVGELKVSFNIVDKTVKRVIEKK